MAEPVKLFGICQEKVPVTDLERSARWYMALLDLRLVREFVEDGVLGGNEALHALIRRLSAPLGRNRHA